MPIGGQLLEVEGPLARRVADLRAAYQVLAGPTWRDPWTVPAPLRGPDPAQPVRVAAASVPLNALTHQNVLVNGVNVVVAVLFSAVGFVVVRRQPRNHPLRWAQPVSDHDAAAPKAPATSVAGPGRLLPRVQAAPISIPMARSGWTPSGRSHGADSA